jgi:hypothetical protein
MASFNSEDLAVGEESHTGVVVVELNSSTLHLASDIGSSKVALQHECTRRRSDGGWIPEGSHSREEQSPAKRSPLLSFSRAIEPDLPSETKRFEYFNTGMKAFTTSSAFHDNPRCYVAFYFCSCPSIRQCIVADYDHLSHLSAPLFPCLVVVGKGDAGSQAG